MHSLTNDFYQDKACGHDCERVCVTIKYTRTRAEAEANHLGQLSRLDNLFGQMIFSPLISYSFVTN